MVPHLARSNVRNRFMVVAVKVQCMWRMNMARNMRKMWIQEAIFSKNLDVIEINYKKKKRISVMELKIILHVNGHMTIRPG